jgi:predicted methyltransferase
MSAVPQLALCCHKQVTQTNRHPRGNIAMKFTTASVLATLIILSGNTAIANDDMYRDAVNNPQRSAADVARDTARKPAEVMAFFGIEAGMDVLDMFAGGGYYTELLAIVVGTEGSVTTQSNAATLQFSGDESAARYSDHRLPNTRVLMAENNQLQLEANSYDAVTMILAYHDIYFDDESIGWPLIDGPALLAELHKGMKAGAVLGIIDHNAAPGSPAETGGTTHRIDMELVIREVEAAGFVLDARSDMLRNHSDDYDKSVFDPEIRGKSDRFVLKFRKPG